MRALCEAVAVLLSKNMTCAQPRCNATSSKHFPHIALFTPHAPHFTLALHLNSSYLSSSHLISCLPICQLLHTEKLLYTTSFYTEKLLHTASFHTQQAFTYRTLTHSAFTHGHRLHTRQERIFEKIRQELSPVTCNREEIKSFY